MTASGLKHGAQGPVRRAEASAAQSCEGPREGLHWSCRTVLKTLWLRRSRHRCGKRKSRWVSVGPTADIRFLNWPGPGSGITRGFAELSLCWVQGFVLAVLGGLQPGLQG